MDQTKNHKILTIISQERMTKIDIITKIKEVNTVILIKNKNTTTVTKEISIKKDLTINSLKIKDRIATMKNQEKIIKIKRTDRNHTNKDNKTITVT